MALPGKPQPPAAPPAASPPLRLVPPAAEATSNPVRVLNVATKCVTRDELIGAFAPFCGDGALFVPARMAIEAGAQVKVKLLVKTGETVFEAGGEIREVQKGAGGSFGREGVLVRIAHVDAANRSVWDEMRAIGRNQPVGKKAPSPPRQTMSLGQMERQAVQVPRGKTVDAANAKAPRAPAAKAPASPAPKIAGIAKPVGDDASPREAPPAGALAPTATTAGAGAKTAAAPAAAAPRTSPPAAIAATSAAAAPAKPAEPATPRPIATLPRKPPGNTPRPITPITSIARGAATPPPTAFDDATQLQTGVDTDESSTASSAPLADADLPTFDDETVRRSPEELGLPAQAQTRTPAPTAAGTPALASVATAPHEQRTPGSPFQLPANPFSELTTNALNFFVEATLTEDDVGVPAAADPNDFADDSAESLSEPEPVDDAALGQAPTQILAPPTAPPPIARPAAPPPVARPSAPPPVARPAAPPQAPVARSAAPLPASSPQLPEGQAAAAAPPAPENGEAAAPAWATANPGSELEAPAKQRTVRGLVQAAPALLAGLKRRLPPQLRRSGPTLSATTLGLLVGYIVWGGAPTPVVPPPGGAGTPVPTAAPASSGEGPAAAAPRIPAPTAPAAPVAPVAPVAATSPPAPSAVPPSPPPAAAPAPAAKASSPAPAGGLRGQCYARVESTPAGATVRLGRKRLGKTPAAQLSIPCGAVALTIERSRYTPVTERVEAASDRMAAISTRLERPRAKLTITSSPEGASIRLNGLNVGRTPKTLSVARFETARLAVGDGKVWRQTLYVRKPDVKLNAPLGGAAAKGTTPPVASAKAPPPAARAVALAPPPAKPAPAPAPRPAAAPAPRPAAKPVGKIFR